MPRAYFKVGYHTSIHNLTRQMQAPDVLYLQFYIIILCTTIIWMLNVRWYLLNMCHHCRRSAARRWHHFQPTLAARSVAPEALSHFHSIIRTSIQIVLTAVAQWAVSGDSPHYAQGNVNVCTRAANNPSVFTITEKALTRACYCY